MRQQEDGYHHQCSDYGESGKFDFSFYKQPSPGGRSRNLPGMRQMLFIPGVGMAFWANQKVTISSASSSKHP